MKILEIHLRNIEIMTILETYQRTSTIMKKNNRNPIENQ